MLLPLDYRDLLKILNKHRVRYLIVGAYAVIYYTEPQYTKDLDVWIEPTLENAKRLYKALKEFGAPLKSVKLEDFTDKDLFYQIGVAPVRVDIMMGIKGLEFEDSWENRIITNFERIKANILGINELIRSKEITGRNEDIKDIERLQCILKKKGKR